MPHRPRLLLAFAAGVAVLAVACGGSGRAPVDRGAAIADARAALGPAATDLGTSATTVAARAEGAVGDPADERVAALRSAVDELASASESAAATSVDAEVEDVRTAADALAQAVDDADALTQQATRVADALEVLLETSAELQEIRAGWDEPGSFSQQLGRFDELQAQADELATDVAALQVVGCPGLGEVLGRAAEQVAATTAELRDLVAARSGTAFDARRSEVATDPYGLGVPSLPIPLAVDSCPAVDEVAASARAVVGSLEDLEQALNPADLPAPGE